LAQNAGVGVPSFGGCPPFQMLEKGYQPMVSLRECKVLALHIFAAASTIRLFICAKAGHWLANS
jgi:hypothetical protein